MAAKKSITVPNATFSTEQANRIREFMTKAQELRKLFTAIDRLVDTEDEDYADYEVQYIAEHGGQLAGDLSDALDNFVIHHTAEGVFHG